MRFWENLLLYVIMTCQMIGPIFYLVWVWRRTGSWWRLAIGTFVTVPVISFVVGGGVLASETAFRVFVLDAGLTGEDIGMTNWEYVWMTFGVCGFYGVMFNVAGLLMSVPLVGGWYLVHRKSFTCVTGHDPTRCAKPT